MHYLTWSASTGMFNMDLKKYSEFRKIKHLRLGLLRMAWLLSIFAIASAPYHTVITA